jgi:hypothetical protein
MRFHDFSLKDWCYGLVVVLLYVLVEWVNSTSDGVSSIILLLKGVF